MTVFGQPGCIACKNTQRWLDRNHVGFEYKDITQDSEARDKVIELGYMGLPVVFVSDDQHWNGFKMDKLESLKK